MLEITKYSQTNNFYKQTQEKLSPMQKSEKRLKVCDS